MAIHFRSISSKVWPFYEERVKKHTIRLQIRIIGSD